MSDKFGGYRSCERPTHKFESTERSSCESSVRFVEHVHPSGVVLPPVFPTRIDDTVPGPGAGMYRTRGDRGRGHSMLLGRNDPRWSGSDAEESGSRGGEPGVPPGARFDPYGPPGVPGFEPYRFARI